ncbi:serine/threonine-protein phosphatase 6 regulatory ankyrin repeat subunit A-like, partial [Coregonus clupeaformis]|uniref:serine/threonine-protein phosphatase 6 regulatory ankyrin repeat subunit A-like n=1 Tax=Coregonus clupeaformis TaxID=59861 RepID=UPI001E1C4E5A
ARVNAKDNKWLTPLHRALASCSEMVRLLLSRGANINAFDKKDRRAIHWAAYMGHIEVVKLLASHGSEVSCKNKKAYTPLHSAASSGMISVVKYLLDLGVDDVVVNELIECGANVNQVYEKGFAPLHFTAASRHGALCLELLVGNGALVNIKSKDGKTPPPHDGHPRDASPDLKPSSRMAGVHGMFRLHLSALSGFSDCCRKLLSSGFDIDTPDDFGRTCLHAAAAVGNLDCLNLLLNTGADFNRKDSFGRSPLHYAAANCNYQCLFALVGSGASVNDLDKRGCTPLHYAAASDTDGKCLEYLLRNDANPGIRDNQGYNAQSITRLRTDTASAYHGHHHAMEVLVQSLLDLDVRNSQGRTPLDLNAFKGHVECVGVLINQGASILVKDFTLKRTPIHAAATNGHSECLRLLIGNADLQSAVDVQGGEWTALTGHEECVEALLQHSASFLVRDCKGRTPVHLVAASGHIGVLGGAPTRRPHRHDTCVEVLLEQEVFHKTEGNSFSPLHCAVINDNEGAAEMLIDTLGPAIVNATDTKRPPLHAAAFTDHVECLQLLLGHNAQVNSPDASGKTSPHDELLVSSAKAELTLQDAVKNTALHLACSKGHETSALLILEKITDRNLINSTNAALQAPLHVAARNGLAVVVQELLVKGASVLAVDENGYTPALACAPNKGVADCLALILATMMPVSPCNPAPSLSFSAINHYTTSPSKSVTFDSLPVLRSEHSSYCSFNNIGHRDHDGGFYKDEELNDSDSETY